MSDFYDELDRKEREGRIQRLFANRPANLHDYQGCANDPNMLREPSAADLDAVAAEERAREATSVAEEAPDEGFEEWLLEAYPHMVKSEWSRQYWKPNIDLARAAWIASR